jgi:hypothetical protein
VRLEVFFAAFGDGGIFAAVVYVSILFFIFMVSIGEVVVRLFL